MYRELKAAQNKSMIYFYVARLWQVMIFIQISVIAELSKYKKKNVLC